MGTYAMFYCESWPGSGGLQVVVRKEKDVTCLIIVSPGRTGLRNMEDITSSFCSSSSSTMISERIRTKIRVKLFIA